MRRVLIVQARMTSTRLPGKVLMDLAGRPMLSQQLRRLKHCQRADEIVVATTVNSADDPVVQLAEAEEVRWYRGSEEDVLGRYIGAARETDAEIVVRLTADCPLADPEVTDRVIEELETHASECDYAANVIDRTYPRGLDTEALFSDVLDRMGRMASSTRSREHVTYFLLNERPDLFALRSVKDVQDNSDMRWTVDTEEDLRLARALYEELHLGQTLVPYRRILDHVRRDPRLAALNLHVQQKAL